MRQSIIEKAIELSTKRCPCTDFKHFCIAFRGKNIISTGFNCFCRNIKHLGKTNSLHAELSALQKIRTPSKSFDIFVFRLNGRDGTWLDSQPCLRCENWIRNYPVNRIYYSTNSGIKFIKYNDLAKTFKNHKHYRNLTDLCRSVNSDLKISCIPTVLLNTRIYRFIHSEAVNPF
jgi:deoxycytidylate deaminase